jgi:hypothetical protein
MNEATKFTTQQDRDRALESKYTIFCDCCHSLLACISRHSKELVAEHLQWTLNNRLRFGDRAALQDWEVERFGERCYPAAHSMLLFGVKVEKYGEGYKLHRKQQENDDGYDEE